MGIFTAFLTASMHLASAALGPVSYTHLRIWLDAILKKELHQVIDWSKVDKEDYLLAMERSPVKDVEIKALLHAALTEKINDREVYMKGIDASYHYEGYYVFKTEDLT